MDPVVKARMEAYEVLKQNVNPFASLGQNIDTLREVVREKRNSLTPREYSRFKTQLSNQIAQSRDLHFCTRFYRESMVRNKPNLFVAELESRSELPQSFYQSPVIAQADKQILQDLINGKHLSDLGLTNVSDTVLHSAAELYPLDTVNWVNKNQPQLMDKAFAVKLAEHVLCGANANDAEQINPKKLLAALPQHLRFPYGQSLRKVQKANGQNLAELHHRLSNRPLGTAELENRRQQNLTRDNLDKQLDQMKSFLAESYNNNAAQSKNVTSDNLEKQLDQVTSTLINSYNGLNNNINQKQNLIDDNFEKQMNDVKNSLMESYSNEFKFNKNLNKQESISEINTKLKEQYQNEQSTSLFSDAPQWERRLTAKKAISQEICKYIKQFGQESIEKGLYYSQEHPIGKIANPRKGEFAKGAASDCSGLAQTGWLHMMDIVNKFSKQTVNGHIFKESTFDNYQAKGSCKDLNAHNLYEQSFKMVGKKNMLTGNGKDNSMSAKILKEKMNKHDCLMVFERKPGQDRYRHVLFIYRDPESKTLKTLESTGELLHFADGHTEPKYPGKLAIRVMNAEEYLTEHYKSQFAAIDPIAVADQKVIAAMDQKLKQVNETMLATNDKLGLCVNQNLQAGRSIFQQNMQNMSNEHNYAQVASL